MKKTNVSVTQVVHGKEYEGEIEGLSNEILKYKLSFGIPIDELDDQVIPEEKQARMIFLKRLFNFTFMKGGKSLDISDELFIFLFGIIGELVISFYNNSQTEDLNDGDGILSNAIRNKDESLLMGMFGASVSIGALASYELSDEHIPNVLK